MQYTSLNRRIHVVVRGKEHVECRHWYWLRRLVGRRGFCRKCEAQFETIVRILRDTIDNDCLATMLSAGDVSAGQRLKGTYGGGRMTKRFLVNIEGS